MIVPWRPDHEKFAFAPRLVRLAHFTANYDETLVNWMDACRFVILFTQSIKYKLNKLPRVVITHLNI